MSFSVYRKIANLILLLVASNLSAQVTYYDAAEFQLLGKATAATQSGMYVCLIHWNMFLAYRCGN